MKNEVKKKMTINSRKSWHQSHKERISATNVNHFFSIQRLHDSQRRECDEMVAGIFDPLYISECSADDL